MVHRLKSTSTNLLIKNSTNTNFIPIALKFVLVEFILVETILVGDPLYYTQFLAGPTRKESNVPNKLKSSYVVTV